MTPAELDALLNGLRLSCDGDRVMCTRERLQAAAAIAELRAEVARLKMNQRCSAIEQGEVGYPCVFRAEAESRIAALEAERDDYKAKWYQSNSELHAAWAERDALKAERADLIKINNKWAGEWDAMREERDALKQDAERYKEVKKYARSGIDMTTNGVKGKTVWRIHLPSASWHSDAWTGDTLDAAIDAARERP